MALVMNDTDMKRMLEELCPEGETYTAMAWGTIMAGTAEVLALGALSNIYCYIGVTQRSFIVAVLGTFDISKINGKICLPFTGIESVKVKHGLIPSQRIIKLKAEGLKLKISLVNKYHYRKGERTETGHCGHLRSTGESKPGRITASAGLRM